MKHIIISTIHIKAEQYCIENSIPLEETLILMFGIDLNFYIFLNKNKYKSFTIHDLLNNVIYTISNVSSIKNNKRTKNVNI